MERSTVVFVTNNYVPYSGGVVSSLLVFRQALRELGHRVYIITLDFTGKLAQEDEVIRVVCPIKFLYKDNPMALPLCATRQLHAILTELKPDIVHSQHPFLLGAAAQKACQKLELPLVFTHHTQYDKYAHYVPLPERLTIPVVNRLVRSYCRRCSLVLAPTNSIKKQLDDVGAPVQVVPSPILPIFADAMPHFVEKKVVTPTQLLSVSRFVPEKNINCLLDLFAQLNGTYQFTLVGYGYYQRMLERYAYGWHALSPEAVRFVVKPAKDTLRDYYLRADLFLFASQTETQGLVLAEAMACGTPVIALHGPGQDDVIEDGINGLLVDDVVHMQRAVKEVMADRELFARLQYGAWQTGRRYQATTLAQQLVGCYQNLLNSKSSVG